MQKALTPEISTWPDRNPQLIGSICARCGFRAGKDFTPFGVGLVQLGLLDEAVIRAAGRLTENDPAKLQFGIDAELTMVPFTTEEDGDELVTFAFRPA